MLANYILTTSLLLAVKSDAIPSLPRGVALFFDQSNLLLVRGPQSESYCEGIDCGNLCIPDGYHCCSDGGAGCPIGSTCIPNGCCPNGEFCEGGGGTITDEAPPPTLLFTTSTLPANTGVESVNPDTISSVHVYESSLSTAYPSTGSAGAVGAGTTSGFPAIGITGASSGVGGAAATSATFNLGNPYSQPSTYVPPVATESFSLPSFSPSSRPSSGSSSGGSPAQQPASGAEIVSRSMALSGMAVIVGLVAVQIL